MMEDRQALVNKSSTRRILIVEKSDMHHLLFKIMLRAYQQERATTRQEALHKVRNEHFDAIVMDVQLSVTEGVEAIRKIREFNKEIPIIMLTSEVNAVHYHKVMEEGYCQYLTKPVTEKELTKAVGRAMTKSINKKRKQVLSE